MIKSSHPKRKAGLIYRCCILAVKITCLKSAHITDSTTNMYETFRLFSEMLMFLKS